MADVTGRHRGRRPSERSPRSGRGQLILVTGLLVAVAMVALVLLLNTAIYTENLASRGADQSGREAVEYRSTVVRAVGELVDAENDREHGSWGTVEANVLDGIDRIDNFTSRNYATGGTIVWINQSTASLTTTEGRLVRQSDPGPFQNESGTSDDWRLASGVDDDEVRDVRLNVTRGSLEPAVGDGFNVYLDDGTDTWQAYVYDSGTEVVVATSIDGGGPTDVCSVAASEATVDLTRGTIDGEPCPGLNWAEGLGSDYDVEFHNGENASGTYDATVDVTGASIDSANVDAAPSTTVYAVPAVYSVSFEIYYESRTLTYRSNVRVAPGEPE